jgi:hypothetical protein
MGPSAKYSLNFCNKVSALKMLTCSLEDLLETQRLRIGLVCYILVITVYEKPRRSRSSIDGGDITRRHDGCKERSLGEGGIRLMAIFKSMTIAHGTFRTVRGML